MKFQIEDAHETPQKTSNEFRREWNVNRLSETLFRKVDRRNFVYRELMLWIVQNFMCISTAQYVSVISSVTSYTAPSRYYLSQDSGGIRFVNSNIYFGSSRSYSDGNTIYSVSNIVEMEQKLFLINEIEQINVDWTACFVIDNRKTDRIVLYLQKKSIFYIYTWGIFQLNLFKLFSNKRVFF